MRRAGLGLVRRPVSHALLRLASVIVVLRALTATGQALPPPFDECAPSAIAPRSEAHVLCLYRAAVRHGRLTEVRRLLEHLGAGAAEHPWPTLVLGYATQEGDEQRALDLYEVAAAGFARLGEAEGEVLARHNLRNLWYRRGEVQAAGRQVALVRATADASGQPLTLARAAVLEASHAIQIGGDVGRAHRTLQRAERLAFPDGPIGLRRTILLNLANASLYLGRLDEAVVALEAHRALRQEDGSTVDAATVAFNLLNARLTQQEQRPRAGARPRLIADARQVLAEVQQLGRPALVAQTHRVLADLTRTAAPDEAAEHLRECLAIERLLAQPELRAGCLWTQSLVDAARRPADAERASREAIAALAASPDSPLLVYAWHGRLRLAWQTLPEEAAIDASLQALDAIERLRLRQHDADTRAALFSHWTRDYYWLAGRLLLAGTARVPEAFAVGERLRARVLLEQLARAGLTALPDQPFATLHDVQQSLSDDEAMLWYALAPWEDVYGDFGGGAWLLAITRHDVRVARLPSTTDLQSQVSALVGLLRDRDGAAARWAPAARRLGRTMLAPALDMLPPQITRLVVVADGDLHALPIEVLVPAAESQAVGRQFDVDVVPSATLWVHLRRRRPVHAGPRAGVVILADPTLSAETLAAHGPFGALPWARREARAIAQTLRLDAALVREGAEASEHALDAMTFDGIAILHVAAHARADTAEPDRSAVYLAPGADDEDGWLQPAEIAALDLRGRVVVLSACDSAGGAVLSGEGPLSLARAFFAAGARAVVATRWPLRDDDAAYVMSRFYEALRDGAGTSEALRRARHDAIAKGLPADAWAGIAVLGDGRGAPLTPQPSATSEGPGPRTIAIVVIVVAAALVMARRRGGLPRRA